jgi:type I restriction enzyme, R subunit
MPLARIWVRIEKLLSELRENRVSAASALAQAQDMVTGARTGVAPAGRTGPALTGTAGAILPLIDDGVADETRAGAATQVAEALEELAKVVDWQHKDDVKRQMRRAIKDRLRSLGLTPAKIEAATAKVMDVARARLG